MSWIITGTEKYETDPYRSNVSLLLHGDGANGSTTIVDNSSSPKTVTAVGNAQISTAQSKFGGSSIAFDGASSLTLDGSSAFSYGTADFTIELWSRWTTANFSVLYDDRPTGGGAILGRIVVHRDTTGVIGATLNNTASLGSTALNSGTWYHIAICRTGTTSRVFVNGQVEITVTGDSSSYANGVSRPIIGADGNNPATLRFNGHIDDLRITKGIARYTANFTPPTAAFPDI